MNKGRIILGMLVAVLLLVTSVSAIIVYEPELIHENPNRHYGFPDAVQARNGDILVFYRNAAGHGESTPGDIEMIRSTNYGRTWGSPITISAIPYVEDGVGGAGVAPNGRIWFLVGHAIYHHELGATWWYSDDNGYTWIEDGGFYSRVVNAEPDDICRAGIDIKTVGRQMYMFTDGESKGDFWPDWFICFYNSSDNGETWYRRAIIQTTYGDEISGEYIGRNRWVAIQRSDNSTPEVKQWTSSDNGYTWDYEVIGDVTHKIGGPRVGWYNRTHLYLAGRNYTGGSPLSFRIRLSEFNWITDTFDDIDWTDTYIIQADMGTDGGYSGLVNCPERISTTSNRRNLIVWYSGIEHGGQNCDIWKAWLSGGGKPPRFFNEYAFSKHILR